MALSEQEILDMRRDEYIGKLQRTTRDYLAAEDEMEAAREALGHARSDGERRDRNPRVLAAANVLHSARKTLKAVLDE